MKILVVEDEPKLNQFLKHGLGQQGYAVDAAETGPAALEMASVNNYDLIILDIMLPGQTGFQVLDNLKEFGIKSPVMMLSALSDSNRVIEALDKGAIDYVKKPFDFGELLARVRAIVRKGEPKQFTQLILEDLNVDRVSRKVFLSDQEIELTKREFLLLEHLMINGNRVISKTEIADKVWDLNFDSGSNVIEVHISALRKKLNSDLIKTKVGLGYYIEGSVIKR
jgi:DNA-binding response OmpR family regulator